MKLATFTQDGATRIGVVEGNEIIDLSVAAPDLPRAMVAFLEAGPAALAAARASAKAGGARLPLASVQIKAPIRRPPKLLAVGLNYADHIRETGGKQPKHPKIFNKQTSSVTGPSSPIHMPRASDQLDYEGELGFVIGRWSRHAPKERAAEVIAGYLIVHDVSVRDWQQHSSTWTMGKSFDTHAPTGPWIVTGDEVGDPHTLAVRTWVNDELRQDSNTKELIFDCYELIAYLSTAFTLEPGDIIATGTPSGVAIGFDPPKFLHVGDVVRIEIEKIGTMENRVIAEPADTARMD